MNSEITRAATWIAGVERERRGIERDLGRTPTPRKHTKHEIKAKPAGTPIRDAGEFRIRRDRVDPTGKVTLRYAGKLRHLSIGRAHKGQHVLMLIDGRDVRVLTTDGKHIADHHIDPDRIYQPRR